METREYQGIFPSSMPSVPIQHVAIRRRSDGKTGTVWGSFPENKTQMTALYFTNTVIVNQHVNMLYYQYHLLL